MSGSHMSLQSQIDSFIKACKTGDLLRVQELLNAAADLYASRSTSQIIRAQNDKALRWAAENGHEHVCRLLIEHGADIRARNDQALRLAAKKGHEAVCRLLLELDPLMARCIKPNYSKGVLRVFQAYGDHEAITEALMGFTDKENDYIASCFISRKSAF